MSARRIVLLILFFWWFNVPGSEAIRTASQISDGNAVKVLLRVLVVFYILLHAPQVLHKRDGSRNWAFHSYLRGIWLYLFVCGVTILFSANKFISAFRWLDTAFISCLAVVLFNKARSIAEVTRALADVLLISAALLAIVAVLFFLAPDWGAQSAGFDADSGERAFRMGGPFLRTSLVGGLSLMLLLFSVGWLAAQRRGCMFMYSLAGLSSFVLLFNHTRSALVIALILSSASIWRATSRPVWRYVSILLVAGAILSSSTIGQVLTRKMPFEGLVTLNSRTYMWATLLSSMSESPATAVVGNGYLMNGSDGLEFYVPQMGRYMTSPHSGYMAVLVGTGICGVICILVVAASWFRIRRQLEEEVEFPILAVHLANLGAMLHTIAASGIWGTTSPQLVLFIMFFAAADGALWLRKGGV